MRKVIVILSVFSMCTSLICNKDKAVKVLPPPTQSGLNTFGCKLNDSLWISDPGIYHIGAYVDHDTVRVAGSKKNADHSIEDITIQILFDINNTAYSLKDSLPSFATYTIVGSSNCIGAGTGYGSVGRKKSVNGALVLSKFDRLHKIVSGTFSFTIRTDYCDTFRFSDGRFDLKFQ